MTKMPINHIGNNSIVDSHQEKTKIRNAFKSLKVNKTEKQMLNQQNSKKQNCKY